MTSFIKTKKAGRITGFIVQWYDNGGQRRTVTLSSRRYFEKNARQLADAVDALLYCRRNGTVPDKATERWLTDAPDDLRTKLAKVGLITVSEPVTLEILWNDFLDRENMKSSTIVSQYMLEYGIFGIFLK